MSMTIGEIKKIKDALDAGLKVAHVHHWEVVKVYYSNGKYRLGLSSIVICDAPFDKGVSISCNKIKSSDIYVYGHVVSKMVGFDVTDIVKLNMLSRRKLKEMIMQYNVAYKDCKDHEWYPSKDKPLMSDNIKFIEVDDDKANDILNDVTNYWTLT